MEPQYSVLVYSKYSQSCKRLFNIIRESGIDFSSLQLLCIDNNEIRKRIKNNKQIDVCVVPSILSIFVDGGVEKYEGEHVFNWVETIIARVKPPQQSRPPRPPQPPIQEDYEQDPQELEDEKRAQDAREYKTRQEQSYDNPQPRQAQPKPGQRSTEDSVSQRKQQPKQPKKIPARMKPIPRTDEQATSIDDILFELNETDRHRLVQQPKRIQQTDGKFLEDDSLFSGEQVDYRHEPGNVVKQDSRKSADVHGIMERAKQLAQGRDEMDTKMNDQSKRPMDARLP